MSLGEEHQVIRLLAGALLTLMSVSAGAGCGSGSVPAAGDDSAEGHAADAEDGGDDRVVLDWQDGTDDHPADAVADEGGDEVTDGEGDEATIPACDADLFVPAARSALPGWWGPGNTEGVYETPDGYAWGRREESSEAWHLVQTPPTFDEFDPSPAIEGLPVVLPSGERAPIGIGVVGAYHPVLSRLLFLVHPPSGSTWGVIYGLDGRLTGSPFLVSDWPVELSELRGLYAAPTSDGFAALVCRQDLAALPESCIGCKAVAIDPDGGTAGARSEVEGLSFNWGAVTWDGSRFVVLHSPGCGAPAPNMMWLAIAPETGVTGPRVLAGVAAGPASTAFQVPDGQVRVVAWTFPPADPQRLSVMRLDVAGSVVAGPDRVFEAVAIGDVTVTSDATGGYAMLISTVPPDPGGNRVTFLRADPDGVVRQSTVLQDRLPTFAQVPTLRWRDDHFIAAWGYPLRIGSLICEDLAP